MVLSSGRAGIARGIWGRARDNEMPRACAPCGAPCCGNTHIKGLVLVCTWTQLLELWDLVVRVCLLGVGPGVWTSEIKASVALMLTQTLGLRTQGLGAYIQIRAAWC